MARFKNRYLGLDIGHHMIKAVELEGSTRNNWQVSGVGVAPTPGDSVADGVIANSELLSGAIRDLIRHNNLTAKHAFCSVSGPAIHFRPLRLPRMKDNQLRKAVQFKAKEAQTATPIDEMIVEYDIQDVDPSAADLDVLMVAAPRAIVESRAEAVSEAGLVVESIDLDGFALMRALIEFSPNPEDMFKTVAIVCMGHTYTEFNIVTRGTFSFPRSIPIGGSHFNHTLRSSLGLDETAVEEMKHLMDVRPLLSSDAYTQSSSPEQLLRPAMEELVRELTRSVNYYQSQFAEGTVDAAVDRVLLCGGGARMLGIQEYMYNRLRLDVEIADPLAAFFQNAASPEMELVSDYSPAMVCALGLALSGLPNK
ncbi:MAG TPA: type IV pilus assembly protein PilM [Armatimonadota bacterium]|nr:type IV pilus assembly protein PilM [Armatimonadota bacterium]